MGSLMVQAIKTKQSFPEQVDDRDQAFEIMKFMTQMIPEWSWAHEYWEKNYS